MSEKKKRLLFQFSFVFVACLIMEIVLRIMGYQPGDMKPNWLNFHPVDSLELWHSFYVNHDGIAVADPNDKQHLEHVNPKVNSDGFRSPEFSQHDSTKKKILFIGDSFTWGFSANPIWDSCFADRIRASGYEVYNTGIPSTDPPQYLAIAQKYIPQIKPDMVFVMFFMGNDIMKRDRRIVPDSLFYYFTNAGCLEADIDGKHFSSHQAVYNYITREKYYIGKSDNIFLALISKSSLLSRLYSVRFRLQEKIEYENQIKDMSISKKYLKKIKQVCEQNSIDFRFVVIAEVKEADMSVQERKEKYADLLSDPELKDYWLVPECSKKGFKDYPDLHLNNKGHRIYADYLNTFLDTKFKGE